MNEYYVTAAPGTEKVLRDELVELGFRSVRLNLGGIPFFGEESDGWRACLTTRIGQRVMKVVGRFKAESLEELYAGTLGLDWSVQMSPETTFAIGAYVHESVGLSQDQAALKVKDGVVDSLRKIYGRRPDVDKLDPDVRIFLYWGHGKVTLYLDLSGVPLFKRGYRVTGGEAPLKETLAASILRLTGWDRQTPLVDPMCGSGTLVTEAALWAANIAPGLNRERFGFQRWADFSKSKGEELNRIKGKLREAGHAQIPRVTGFDIDGKVLEHATRNARSAGLRLAFRQMPLRELQSDGVRRFLVTNPPYGIRLDADHQIYQELNAAVQRLHGWRVCIFTGNPALKHTICRKPVEEWPLKNGGIDCRLLIFEC